MAFSKCQWLFQSRNQTMAFDKVHKSESESWLCSLICTRLSVMSRSPSSAIWRVPRHTPKLFGTASRIGIPRNSKLHFLDGAETAKTKFWICSTVLCVRFPFIAWSVFNEDWWLSPSMKKIQACVIEVLRLHGSNSIWLQVAVSAGKRSLQIHEPLWTRLFLSVILLHSPYPCFLSTFHSMHVHRWSVMAKACFCRRCWLQVGAGAQRAWVGTRSRWGQGTQLWLRVWLYSLRQAPPIRIDQAVMPTPQGRQPQPKFNSDMSSFASFTMWLLLVVSFLVQRLLSRSWNMILLCTMIVLKGCPTVRLRHMCCATVNLKSM